jgi:beta-N-acetylhexosaminidase
MIDPGRLFMFGIEGTRPRPQTVALLKAANASGVLLLARNIQNPLQTRALTQGLQDRLGRGLLFAVDHEGGNVLRFQRGLTVFPGNAALGRLGSDRAAAEVGRQMGSELRALGIEMNLAPVLDVLTERYNPGIGLRSFGSDPDRAARLGAAFIQGIESQGVRACAKHFPGKGAATKDAHVELPTIHLSRPDFEKGHLLPFRAAIRAGVSAVMSSHVLYPFFDTLPATFSKRIATGLLRGEMGFEGALFTDDLCMGAVLQDRTIPAAALEACLAGHDVLLIATDPREQRRAVELLREGHARGQVAAARLAESMARVERLLEKKPKSRRLPDFSKGALLCRRIARGALRVFPGAARLPVSGRDALLVLFPDLRSVTARFTFEGGALAPERTIRRAFASWRTRRFERVPLDGSYPDERLRMAVAGAGAVIYFCFEAARFAPEKAVLESLRRLAPSKTVICCLRNPLDRELAPEMTAVVPYGYHAASLAAALAAIIKGPR